MTGAARKGDKQHCDQVNVVSPETVTCWIFKKAGVVAKHEGGPILTGSADVNINGRPAARAADTVDCTPVGDKTGLLGTGAEHVKINGRNAARMGSRTSHEGAVLEGSADVIIGGEEVGAVVGDDAAATKACKTASAQRANGSVQGGQMNCGQESVRQLCIQRCQTQNLPADAGACKAANTPEGDWYTRYMEKEKVEYNKNNEQDKQEVIKLNDKNWARVTSATSVSRELNKGQFTPGPSWTPEQGNTIYLHRGDNSASTSTGQVTIKRLPVIDDPKKTWSDGGFVGSNPEGRARFLESECGIKATPGENTATGIAGDLGDGKVVVASVDVGRLNGRADEGPHAVTVSKMVFGKDGKLVSVTMNDSSAGGMCGRVVPADVFQKALIPGRTTNVV